MKKTYILKTGNVEKVLSTAVCLGTNDESLYPKDDCGDPFYLNVHFTHELEDGRLSYITENPIEIWLLTEYLIRTANPFFYDADDPENYKAYYSRKAIKKELGEDAILW